MYAVHIRLREKELVKQNEINKKRALTNESAQKGNDNTTGSTTADKASDTLTENIKTKRPKYNPDNSTAAAPSAIAAEEKQNKNEITGMRATVTKSAKDKVGSNLALNDKKAPETEIKSSSKPGNSLDLSATKEPGGEGNRTNNAKLENGSSFQKSKREPDLATVPEREISRDMIEPGIFSADKKPNLIIGNTKETNDNKQIAANRKSVIKPFKGSRFSATAFYSKNFVSMSVSNDRHNFREEDKNEIKNKESISNSSSKGVLVNYNIRNRWSLQSGLIFSSMTTDIQTKNIFARPDNRGNVNYRFNCSAGYSYVTLKSGNSPAPGDSVTALSATNTLQYVAVPFGLSYNVPIGRLSLQPDAGLAANFLTKGSIETVVATQAGNERHDPDRIEGLNSSYVNGSISLAANYYFTKNIALNLTPVARFALSAINKDAPVKTYINSFGLAAGLTIHF
jgi:hypothetical protein